MSAIAATRCFHCTSPVGGDTRYSVLVDGVARAVCCGGCQAAAGLILGQGLGRFLRLP